MFYETNNFYVEAYKTPFISREDGGHIIIRMKNAVSDRTKLQPNVAKELMRLTMLVGEAMEIAMNKRGIPVVKINYADFGNWAFKKPGVPEPKLHVHLFGRAKNAVKQVFPEAPYLPARESGFYDGFEPLNDEDVKEILLQISLLEKMNKYDLANW